MENTIKQLSHPDLLYLLEAIIKMEKSVSQITCAKNKDDMWEAAYIAENSKGK